MSRAVIFGSAPVADWGFLRPYLRPDDAVICADGGRRAAQALGLTPDWYVGDDDSGGYPGDCPSDLLPSEKDVTDLDMAVSRALRRTARPPLFRRWPAGADLARRSPGHDFGPLE